MPRHFKLDDVLTEQHRGEFETLAADAAVTIDRLGTWLRRNGYRVSRGAVHNWRRHYKRLLADPILRLRATLLHRIEKMPGEQLPAVEAFIQQHCSAVVQ